MSDSVKKWYDMQDALADKMEVVDPEEITVSKKYKGTVILDNVSWEFEIYLKN